METDVSNPCAFFIIQSDWNDVLWKVGNKVWISLKHHGSKRATTHGEILNKGFNKNGLPVFNTTDQFEVKAITKHTITISCSVYGVSTLFIAPDSIFTDVHKKSITSLDISEGGGLGVSASIDETLHIWDTSSGIVRRVLDGHLGDINSCRFFPSGMVVLSGGMDTQLKIWSAEDGQCARTLNGSHRGGVLSVSIVERGRNIISCSRDGTVLLWECGSGTCISTIASGRSEVNACDIVDLPPQLLQEGFDTDNIKNELEIGTEGKLLTIACENGNLEGFNIATKSLVFSLNYTSSLNCCCFISGTILAAGAQDGAVLLMDIRKPRCFLSQIKFCESPILSLCSSSFLHGKPGVWVSSGNGICALYRLIVHDEPSANGHGDSQDGRESNSEGSLSLVCSLTGPDCDPVYKVVESKEGFVFTACRDAIIRKYNLKNSLRS